MGDWASLVLDVIATVFGDRPDDTLVALPNERTQVVELFFPDHRALEQWDITPCLSPVADMRWRLLKKISFSTMKPQIAMLFNSLDSAICMVFIPFYATGDQSLPRLAAISSQTARLIIIQVTTNWT